MTITRGLEEPPQDPEAWREIMHIRHTEAEDLEEVMGIYENAQRFMVSTGNVNQWKPGYPARESIERDIELKKSYVCIDDEGDIACVFYFAVEEEPTYAKIYEGSWPDEKEYGVVHRIAVAKSGKGVAGFCLDRCYEKAGRLRIDTHRDNSVMRRTLVKNGFTQCGIIYLANGDERIAYYK